MIERTWLFLLLPLFLFAGCDTRDTAQDRPADRAVPVGVSEVEARTFLETIEDIGTLRAERTIEIKPEIAGIVTGIHFVEGERVNKGDLLFTLDDSKLLRELREREASLKAAEARVVNAEKSFERTKRLFHTNAVSQDEYDKSWTEYTTAKAEVGRLKAAVGLARERRQDTRIYSPADGVTSQRSVESGDYVAVGASLVSLYVVRQMELEMKVPERYLDRLSRGQTAELTAAAYPDRLFTGTVRFVSPAVDVSSRRILVKILVPNEEGLLLPGAFMRVKLITEEKENRPAIPEEALVPTLEGYVVFVVKDGVARKKEVVTGLREDAYVEILQGPAVGEQVVRTGQMSLSDEDRVHIEESASQAETVSKESRP
jgi:membrane fusion protein, multidrug efflux system